MRLIGSYFDLTDRFTTSAAAGSRDMRAADRRESEVLISVAKRLVASAVRRNTVKRIVRESWRAALREAGQARRLTSQSTQHGTDTGSAQPAVQDSVPAGGASDGIRPARVCLVRLKRYPGMDLKAPKASRRSASKVRSGVSSVTAGTDSAKTPGVAARTGLAAIRRSLRADADQLFAAFLQARPIGRPPSGPSSGRSNQPSGRSRAPAGRSRTVAPTSR